MLAVVQHQELLRVPPRPRKRVPECQVSSGNGNFASSESSTVVPGGFPWETLPKGTKIVDVGGGVGSACQEITKKNQSLKFTIQDPPRVANEAIAVSIIRSAPMLRVHMFTGSTQYWNHHEPKAIAEGQVTIQGHDFFTPQPIRDADVFLIRYTLHNWSDAKAIETLKRLREVATVGKTRVVVIDGLIQYACAIDREKVPGAEDIVFAGPKKKGEVPAGLLPNLGRAEARNYCLDLKCGLLPLKCIYAPSQGF